MNIFIIKIIFIQKITTLPVYDLSHLTPSRPGLNRSPNEKLVFTGFFGV